MKKKILTTLSVVLILGLAALGILAYLMDEDSDVNVMTLGNVDIEQHEYQRVTNADGTYKTATIDEQTSYVLEDFEQDKALLPSAVVVSSTPWDSITVRMSQVNSYGGMQTFLPVTNAQDKFVTVENTGKSDAYIRTLVAIEVGSAEPSLISFSNHLTWEDNEIGVIEIDGNNYYLHEFSYTGGKHLGGQHENGILPAGETSYPNLSQVYIKSVATNEDMVKLDGHGNGTLDILVVSQAVQTAGFADAQTALDTAFGDVTTTNHPWVNAVFSAEKALEKNGNTYSMDGDAILTDESLFSDHTATAPYTVDGNGATVTGIATSIDAFQWEGGTIPAMSPIFSSEDGSKVTVKDITFTGTMSAVMAGHYVNSSSNWYNTEFNKVNIVDAEVVSFSAGISPALAVYGKLVMNNCNVYGTKLSSLDTDPMWPVYDMAVVNYSDTTINNSKIGSIYMWNQAKVTVADGTTVDSILVAGNMNTTKYGLTVKAGANVGAIDLTKITNVDRINITIEDGATLGGFVDNGVKYSTLDAWKVAQ